MDRSKKDMAHNMPNQAPFSLSLDNYRDSEYLALGIQQSCQGFQN